MNVSLDTLDPARFATLTRRDRHADVLAGLTAAASAGLVPVKINAVLMHGVNDDEASPLLRFALEHGYELRFIEQMPLDAQHTWRRERDGDRRGDPGRACERRSTCSPTRSSAVARRPRPGWCRPGPTAARPGSA